MDRFVAHILANINNVPQLYIKNAPPQNKLKMKTCKTCKVLLFLNLFRFAQTKAKSVAPTKKVGIKKTYIHIYLYIHIYKRIYIYVCVVESITWPHFSLFGVNNLATVESTTRPPSKKPVLWCFWSAQFSGGGAKVYLKKLFFFCVKIGVFRKWVVAFFLGVGGGDCYCMMLLDALEGCSKNPIKTVFFSTLLLDAKTEKHPPKIRQNKANCCTALLRGEEALKVYRSVFHFFQKSGFPKS